jgi:hypothetical protein
MYDTGQGVANVLFTGGSDTVYLGNADGNGGYAGTWYQLWAGVNSTIAGNLTANGNFNTNGINGTAITATSSVNIDVAAGQNALIWYYVPGARQWYAGCMSTGAYYLCDNTGGAVRFQIDTSGHATFSNDVTCSGNFNTNGITGSSLYITGGSTLVGTISCNAINSTTINTQGNTITTGAVNGGAFSCTTLNTNGNTITAGPINCGNVAAGTMSCSTFTTSDGVIYSNIAGSKRVAFSTSGNTLNFWVNGANTGTWTFNSASDERLKRNIGPSRGDALAELASLRLISFDMPIPGEALDRHNDYGFSAQDVQAHIPEAVNETNLAPEGEAEQLRLTLDVVPLIARLVGAVQQLTTRIQILETRGR